jgi:hypothetical protein
MKGVVGEINLKGLLIFGLRSRDLGMTDRPGAFSYTSLRRSRKSAKVIDLRLSHLIGEQGVSAILTANDVRSMCDCSSMANRESNARSFNEPRTVRLNVTPSTIRAISCISRSTAGGEIPRIPRPIALVLET